MKDMNEFFLISLLLLIYYSIVFVLIVNCEFPQSGCTKGNECVDISVVQPLLPPSTKGNAWTNNSTGSTLSPPMEYYDEDDKTDGLAIHRGGVPNGVIKIDIPAPLREEPRFPKEKWKTFIGLCHICFLIS